MADKMINRYIRDVESIYRFIVCFWLVAVAYIFFPLAMHAQSPADEKADLLKVNARTQGKLFVGSGFGMGIGFRSDRLSISNSTALFDFAANPKIGYFLVDNFLVGGAIDIYGSVVSYNYLEDYRLLFGSYQLFGRYYLPKSFFAELQMGLGRGTESNSLVNGLRQENSLQIRNYSIGSGVYFDFSPKISFEIMLRYRLATAMRRDVSAEFQLNGLNVMAVVSFAPW